MREDFWEYDPTHKLWMITNHKPVIHGTDTAIWRRIRLIPFVVTIPPEKRDNRLLEKLKGELGGILGWAIEGCLLWQKEGLAPPKSVVNATAAYRHEMDAIGSFLDECCEVNHDPSKATLFTTKEKVVYEAYLAWAKSGGEYVMPRKQFTEQLSVKGIERIRRNSGMFLVGVRLISGNDETESGPHRKRKCDVCGGKGCVQCNFSGWRAYTL
jgi:putative DNA primase/helicase